MLEPDSSDAKSVDKFIVFLDVLGWKSFVRKTEEENNLSVRKAVDILQLIEKVLNTKKDMCSKDGPDICREAPKKQNDVDFCFTMSSDSVVISTEVSQAGLINLLHCCHAIYFSLIMRKGLMCRGYIVQGPIYHTEDHCLGTGLGDTVDGEKQVSIFRTEDGESGTPFIELDRRVIQFINEEVTDPCVKQVLKELVYIQNDVGAIFPFRRLDPGLYSTPDLDEEESKRRADAVMTWIETAESMMKNLVDPTCEKVLRRQQILGCMLDRQREVCEAWLEQQREGREPFPHHRFDPEHFPSMFGKDKGK